MVCRSSEHLLSLINDVLDLSKIEAGQLQLDWSSFDLGAVIGKVVEGIRPLGVKKGLAIQMGVSPEVGVITGDPRRVEQVLLNLLSNALKFTENGSVRVEAEMEIATSGSEAEIEGSVGQPAEARKMVAIRVIDTGPGIREEDLGRLFRPFSQLDSSTGKRHDGTGLGLSISKRLVEHMGGGIWVKSEWGKGSTFGVDLPTEGGQKN